MNVWGAHASPIFRRLAENSALGGTPDRDTRDACGPHPGLLQSRWKAFYATKGSLLMNFEICRRLVRSVYGFRPPLRPERLYKRQLDRINLFSHLDAVVHLVREELIRFKKPLEFDLGIFR